MDTSLCYAKFSMTKSLVILSVSEKSKEFKTRLIFLDTSPKAQYNKTL